ncbi:MAG: Jag N-terminal domain-containing protein [Endomicrobium sp.]|jgi:spoIIIJ-associated protein|nr:Jag N-terminal domain-containing protein [Endomicrobium sp.]
MPEIEFKGKTVLEAINNGLLQLGCNKEDVEIKIVSEGSKGLFGLMGAKPAVVLISVEEFKYNNKIFLKSTPKKICKRAELILTKILSEMNMGFSKIESFFRNNTVNLNITVTKNSFIIDKSRQTLKALEYIAQIIVNKEFNTAIKVNLDCEITEKNEIKKYKI